MKKYILFFLPSLFLLLLFQSTGRAHSKQLLFASNLIIDSKTITINDEDLKSVFNPKAGKLSSIIDKKEITQITKLKISGEISSKDIKYIGKMPNITLLDLSEATGNFEEFPLMPNLSELYLPKALLLKSWVEKSIGECTNIEVLSVCINEAKSAGYRRHYTYNYFSNLPKLRKVIVSNVLSTGVREHGGFNETQEIDTLVFQTSKHDYVGFEPKVVIDENGKSILQKNDVNDKNRFCGINILRDLGGSEKRNEHNEKKITLPNVEIVGQDFFRDSFIEKITFSPYIKEIKTGAFDNCQLLSEIEFQSGTELLHIKNCAFGQCISLEQIELPKNLKKLGDKTFINCIRLQNIIFPEGLVEIPHGCISGCFRMNKIVMPKSVTKIGSWNDRRQHNTYPVTADFYFKSSTPPTIKEGDFIRYGGKVHIPKGSITAYYNVMGDKVEYIEE